MHFATPTTPAGQPRQSGGAGFSRFGVTWPASQRWHESGIEERVFIAVPNCQGRVSPVLDVASRLVLVRLKGGAEVERRAVVLFERQSEGMVRSLKECGVKVVICGAVSQGLMAALVNTGIRVVSHVCGELESVIAAFQDGTLSQPEFVMPGCCGKVCGVRRSRRARRQNKACPVRAQAP